MMKEIYRFLRSFLAPTLLFLFFTGIVLGCKKEGEGEYDVIFYWTPSGTETQQGPLTETYKFLCLDNSIAGCNVYSFQDIPHDSDNWMSYPEAGGACTDFIAVIDGPGGEVFTFIGPLGKPLQEGGIRATGYYTKDVDGMTVETGTFTATSSEISGESSPTCHSK